MRLSWFYAQQHQSECPASYSRKTGNQLLFQRRFCSMLVSLLTSLRSTNSGGMGMHKSSWIQVTKSPKQQYTSCRMDNSIPKPSLEMYCSACRKNCNWKRCFWWSALRRGLCVFRRGGPECWQYDLYGIGAAEPCEANSTEDWKRTGTICPQPHPPPFFHNIP